MRVSVRTASVNGEASRRDEKKRAREQRSRRKRKRARTTVTGNRYMSSHRGHARDAFRVDMSTSTSASPGFSTDIVAGAVTGARDTDECVASSKRAHFCAEINQLPRFHGLLRDISIDERRVRPRFTLRSSRHAYRHRRSHSSPRAFVFLSLTARAATSRPSRRPFRRARRARAPPRRLGSRFGRRPRSSWEGRTPRSPRRPPRSRARRRRRR